MFGREDNKVRITNAQIDTFIGGDTRIEGTLITQSSVRIDGTVVGGVVAEGTVVLTQQGQIQGNIIAENIIVAGVVDGNMQIKDKTNIEPTGEIYGDITTRKLLIDEESIFQGQCYMNRDKEEEKKRRRSARKAEKERAEQEFAQPVYEQDSEDNPIPSVSDDQSAPKIIRKRKPTDKLVEKEDISEQLEDADIVEVDLSES